MGKDIENLVSSCETCAKQQAANPKEPMIPSEVLSRAWSKIGMDLFELSGTHYLLTVDYLSKWPEIARLESLTSRCVITHVKSMFSRYGIPDVRMSAVKNLRILHLRTRSRILLQANIMLKQMDRRNAWYKP
jgi:hypothetical protein